MKVEAQCDGGMRAEAAEPVLVRRAVLQAELEGPRLQFVDSVATYRIRLKNLGNASARQVSLSATLPDGAKYVGASEGAAPSPGAKRVQWKFEELAPGAEKLCEVRCALATAGVSRLDLAVAGQDDLALASSLATRVEAMADLGLEVVNPAGPVPMNEEASYELRVFNRGTKAAEAVEINVFFSQGVEPTTVQGAGHRIGAGQVTLTPIPSLAPGKELRVKIAARAQTPGSHIFRAELHCRPLGARLIREETTLFYAADGGSADNVVSTDPGSRVPLRSADRRQSPLLAPVAPPGLLVPPGDNRPTPR